MGRWTQWTDLTYVLHRDHVSWDYYAVSGTKPDCQDPATLSCAPVRQAYLTSLVNAVMNGPD